MLLAVKRKYDQTYCLKLNTVSEYTYMCFSPQVTLSYGGPENKHNVVSLTEAFSVQQDPTRCVHHCFSKEVCYPTSWAKKSNKKRKWHFLCQLPYICVPVLMDFYHYLKSSNNLFSFSLQIQICPLPTLPKHSMVSHSHGEMTPTLISYVSHIQALFARAAKTIFT